MTGTYEWNPMPHILDIKCPWCGRHAVFEFGEVVRITLKKDIAFFEESDLFEYYQFKDSCGHKWHGAVFYANLHGGSTEAIHELPEGYKPENWNHSKYLTRSQGTDLGSVSCGHCHTRKPYILNWPYDAFYSINVKNKTLWAFNRESAVDLRDYIESTDRKTSKYRWASFLLHIPTTFKKHSVRDSVVKKINRLLAF
ncbi:hypothetical protein [Marinobacterium mangrovicola]|uniref:Uncharacterized protein n=1 Tax=Marinobacterium mangrovicola TaxID=1476959 RepID=A0A4R1GED6_9GAMM|nr:hypothetical protein [Marinobacterium mangrovicola]TCK02592.1 hypothetical protein CLV83_4288 [Marinobacterium mangrovicola]